MRKTLQVILRDARSFINSFHGWWRLGFIIIFLLMVFRVLYPVLHIENGYVLYLYPFFEQEICLKEICNIDRSRTFTAVGTLGLTFLGLWYIKNEKKNED